jgi:hypothetical protein
LSGQQLESGHYAVQPQMGGPNVRLERGIVFLHMIDFGVVFFGVVAMAIRNKVAQHLKKIFEEVNVN